MRRWRAENPDKVDAYYQANKEALNHRSRQHYADNKQQYRENYLRWVTANKEQWTEYRNRWSRENGSGHRGRARRYGVRYTRINRITVFERDGWVCGICGDPVDRNLAWPEPGSATLDHVIPMSRGGHHEPDNVQLAHFSCNLDKRDRWDEP